ncbi:MAG: curli-like amyloid fiber formation chaperone CsgH [Bacteroidota bacterium]
MKAWIELDFQDGDAMVRAFFFNASNQTQTLSYQLKVDRSGINGTAQQQQNGAFTVLPDETKVLGKIQFYKANQSFYKIALKVYDELELILQDSLVYGSDPNTTKKQTPPPAPATATPSPLPSIASDNKPLKSTTPDNLEIDGLIIDETRSKIARDFYDLFYNKWIAPRNASNYSILVRELPSRGRGARVAILINDKEIVQRFVPPRYETIETLVNNAIGRARQYLSKNEDLKQQLLNEDQSGSGIF